MANQIYEIVIPEMAEDLIKYWAMFTGWRPTVYDANTNAEVPNPILPIQAAFMSALLNGSASAITMMTNEAAEDARAAKTLLANQMVAAIAQETTFLPSVTEQNASPMAAPMMAPPMQTTPNIGVVVRPKAKQ